MEKSKAFHEVFTSPPAVVKKTLLRKGKKAAHKQMVAIAMSKAEHGKK